MKTLSFPARRQSGVTSAVRFESFEGALRLSGARRAGLRNDRARLQACLARLRWQARQVERTARILQRCAERLRRCQRISQPSS